MCVVTAKTKTRRSMIAKPKRTVDRPFLDSMKQKECVVCGRLPGDLRIQIDPSHIRSVGAGGPDEEFNVVSKCRLCHSKWHAIPHSKFCRQHPTFKKVLEDMGWSFGFGNKLWHPKLNKKL